MDLTYENNKGLYAFVMAFMIILAVFLPTTSTYAGNYGAPTGDFRTATVKFKTHQDVRLSQYDSGGGNIPHGFVNYTIRMQNSELASKVSNVVVYNVTQKKDITSNFIVNYKQASEARAFTKASANREYIAQQGDEIQLTYVFSEVMPKSSFYAMEYENLYSNYVIGSASFLKTVPPVNVKVPVEVQKVKDLPVTLGKVAGIATLAGCLILGTLLAVGSVRRLISLFIR